MTMKEFYETYNLNKYNFAAIAGVGTRSLIKYAEGKSIREDTKERIELAMRVAEKYGLKRPEYEPGFHDVWFNSRFNQSVWEYEDRFKALIKAEDP